MTAAVWLIVILLVLANVFLVYWMAREYRRESPDPVERKRAAFRQAADYHLRLPWLALGLLAALLLNLWTSGWPSLTALSPIAALGAVLGALNTAVLLGRSELVLRVFSVLPFMVLVIVIPSLNTLWGLGIPRSDWVLGMKLTAILVAMFAYVLIQLLARPWVRRLRETLGEEPVPVTPAHLAIPKGVEP